MAVLRRRGKARRFLHGAAALLLVLILAVSAAWVGPYMARVKRFPADAAAGYHADFFLYLAPGARSRAAAGEPVTLLVQPNNSGRTSDDLAKHRRDAWWMGFERKRIADRLGVALLVPAFPRPATGWEIYTHALDRDVLTTDRPELARLDLQLIAMIDAARTALAARGLATRERVLIQGFSASGMFANRFTALHPERVLAAVVGAPGGWPLVPAAAVGADSLAYPAGVADLEALTGRAFDAAAFAAVPQLFVQGALDDNDSVDFSDGWDEAPAAQVDRLFGADPQARWPRAEALYREAGANARFGTVPGVGHDRRALQGLGVEFFAELIERGEPR